MLNLSYSFEKNRQWSSRETSRIAGASTIVIFNALLVKSLPTRTVILSTEWRIDSDFRDIAIRNKIFEFIRFFLIINDNKKKDAVNYITSNVLTLTSKQ